MLPVRGAGLRSRTEGLLAIHLRLFTLFRMTIGIWGQLPRHFVPLPLIGEKTLLKVCLSVRRGGPLAVERLFTFLLVIQREHSDRRIHWFHAFLDSSLRSEWRVRCKVDSSLRSEWRGKIRNNPGSTRLDAWK